MSSSPLRSQYYVPVTHPVLQLLILDREVAHRTGLNAAEPWYSVGNLKCLNAIEDEEKYDLNLNWGEDWYSAFDDARATARLDATLLAAWHTAQSESANWERGVNYRTFIKRVLLDIELRGNMTRHPERYVLVFSALLRGRPFSCPEEVSLGEFVGVRDLTASPPSPKKPQFQRVPRHNKMRISEPSDTDQIVRSFEQRFAQACI